VTIKVIKTADGGRNASFEVSGFLEKSLGDKVFLLCELGAKVRFTNILFAIQEKAGLYLWWDKAKKNLVLPLESRGNFKLDGVQSPEDWDFKLWASAFNVDQPKGFLLILDFDK
jgi:hypothetical protein